MAGALCRTSAALWPLSLIDGRATFRARCQTGAMSRATAIVTGACGGIGAAVSVSPGMIDTPIGQQEKAAGFATDRMLEVTPAGRMGVPAEIAAVISFLASPTRRHPGTTARRASRERTRSSRRSSSPTRCASQWPMTMSPLGHVGRSAQSATHFLPLRWIGTWSRQCYTATHVYRGGIHAPLAPIDHPSGLDAVCCACGLRRRRHALQHNACSNADRGEQCASSHESWCDIRQRQRVSIAYGCGRCADCCRERRPRFCPSSRSQHTGTWRGNTVCASRDTSDPSTARTRPGDANTSRSSRRRDDCTGADGVGHER